MFVYPKPRGTKISFQDEIFVIKSIDNRRQPPLFKLKDLANQNIIGSFYKEELTPSILKKIYPIKILKTKILANGKKKFYVAYEGWPSQFNEWIASNNILTYDHEKKIKRKSRNKSLCKKIYIFLNYLNSLPHNKQKKVIEICSKEECNALIEIFINF